MSAHHHFGQPSNVNIVDAPANCIFKHGLGRRESIRRPILPRKHPLPLNHRRLEIIIGITAFVASRSIPRFEIHHVFRRFIDQMMPVAGTGLESGAHAGVERGAAFVGDECGAALQDVNEFVLLGVRVAQRRDGTRSETREVDAKVGEAEDFAEGALFAARHA